MAAYCEGRRWRFQVPLKSYLKILLFFNYESQAYCTVPYLELAVADCGGCPILGGDIAKLRPASLGASKYQHMSMKPFEINPFGGKGSN